MFVQMQAGQESGGDLYGKRVVPENATGGVALGPASAASAAVERAAALGGPRMLRCDLCQVSTPHLGCGDMRAEDHLDHLDHLKTGPCLDVMTAPLCRPISVEMRCTSST